MREEKSVEQAAIMCFPINYVCMYRRKPFFCFDSLSWTGEVHHISFDADVYIRFIFLLLVSVNLHMYV